MMVARHDHHDVMIVSCHHHKGHFNDMGWVEGKSRGRARRLLSETHLRCKPKQELPCQCKSVARLVSLSQHAGWTIPGLKEELCSVHLSGGGKYCSEDAPT